ncbi:glycoside hydrolase family 19 protein [Deinococcus roseus]|uniref:Glycoside hydrolase family 19 catalytic domain-containing protein n=1 Tax=Deinococcus roseus TaxID=392414 RepID=A0ABQ2CTJ2_9DEIO|nr:glycoside hydrolase family 19 protein [Deinococcus roseus]GGJ19586.1 hypothetical protein GCM10008938_02130 [Deinococcus roseus]
MITKALIQALNPNLKQPDVTAAKLQHAADQYGINTTLRLAHWLAQLTAESGLVPQEENLNYSAKRLCQVWPSRFPSLQAAQSCAMNPQALGNTVYGGRMGNTQPGDGFKYRGRGFIQLTGRSNYTRYSQLTGFDLVNDPDLLLQIGVSAQTAAAFWQDHHINAMADRNDLQAVTRAINGGLIGLPSRQAYLQKIMALLH